MTDKGLRFNSGKLPYHLVSPYATKELVKVLDFGATKYAPRNWERGLKWESECLSSLLRHIEAWRSGEDNDPETGLSHMAHVMCNAMFLMHFISTGTGEDDRQHYTPTKEQQLAWKTASPLAPTPHGAASDISPSNEPTQGN